MKSTINVRTIVVTAALGALTVLMGITGVGMIPLPTVSITVMHIPVIIGAILIGPWCGGTVGLIMGVYALIRAVMSPVGVLDPFFVNPFVSILPRVLLGVAAWAIYAGSKRLLSRFSSPSADYVAIVLSSFFGTLCHTIFVMAALFVVNAIDLKIALTIIAVNGLPEAAAAVVVTLAVIATWRGIDGSHKKSALSQIDTGDTETK